MSERKAEDSTFTSKEEALIEEKFYDLFKNCPIPKNEILENLFLFIKRQSLSRFLFLHELYKKIINIHGIVIEFGVRWGQNLALFESFRGMYEPYNYNRKIVGFDTFEGFPTVHIKDDSNVFESKVGAYRVTENYEEYLDALMAIHENYSPISHIKKYEIVKGNVINTIGKYLSDNPETIVAMAYFDLDLYEPTLKCLEAIKPYLTKGSVLGFDELNHPHFPGETIALKEVFGLNRFKLNRNPLQSHSAFIVID